MPVTPPRIASPDPAPGRECGTCTLCCKVYHIPELKKPAGTWCGHCRQGAGCAIHPDRPGQCRDFFCLWMTQGDLPPVWKPERSKIVLSIFPFTGFLCAQVDPGAPQAWRKAPYYDDLRRWAKQLLDKNRHVVVFVNDSATVVMPDGAYPLGPMTPRDNFRLEPAFGPNGPGYRVVKM